MRADRRLPATSTAPGSSGCPRPPPRNGSPRRPGGSTRPCRTGAASPSLLAEEALLVEEALLAGSAEWPGTGNAAAAAGTSSGSAEQNDAAEAAYPFLSEVWLRTELRKLVEDFGAGMAEKQAADPGHLLAEAVRLLASLGLVAKVDGGVLVLPLLARYRSVTAQIKNPPPVAD